jgi:hypoxanthine phosphoribosyltransferase
MNQYYKYQQFDNDCQKIVKWVKKNKLKFRNVYGLPRGGLVLAVKLSHLLDIPLLIHRVAVNQNTLVVDDISDTGDTLQLLKDTNRAFKKCKVVTLFIHKNTKVMPDFFCREKKDKWIHYFWEK